MSHLFCKDPGPRIQYGFQAIGKHPLPLPELAAKFMLRNLWAAEEGMNCEETAEKYEVWVKACRCILSTCSNSGYREQ
jgi:hypothetical protein